MSSNSDLLNKAKVQLSGKWGLAIGTFLVYMILSGTAQAIPKIGPFLGLVITGPLSLGFILFSLNIARDREARLEQIFDGFKNMGTAIAAYLLTAVFVIIGIVLLVVPGIVIGLMLSQTMFLVADHPEMGAYDAMGKSREMMDGHKMKMLGLALIIFGLGLLCILTLGIGFLWLGPLAQVAMSHFYLEVREDFESRGGVIMEQL